MEIDEMDKSNKRLTEIFATVGKTFRYDTVNAEFMAFRDFKCTWQRSYKWVDFRISDYLEDAPDDVLISLAQTLFRKIRGDEYTTSDRLREWVTDPSFHEQKQNVYLSRCAGYTCSPEGTHKSLQEAYDRLIGAGLVPYDPSIVLTWYDGSYTHKAAGCSVLMRVVAISDALDADDIPDFVLDYCLYYELCHLLVGYDPDKDVGEGIFDGLESKFPQKFEAQSWMRKICVYV
ncbi:MAG: hypothetical protein J5707_00585 [Candidatus Methanomethylophilus sp.]|nr:hypothetical protein [Methanomethylophilus sp.]